MPTKIVGLQHQNKNSRDASRNEVNNWQLKRPSQIEIEKARQACLLAQDILSEICNKQVNSIIGPGLLYDSQEMEINIQLQKILASTISESAYYRDLKIEKQTQQTKENFIPSFQSLPVLLPDKSSYNENEQSLRSQIEEEAKEKIEIPQDKGAQRQWKPQIFTRQERRENQSLQQNSLSSTFKSSTSKKSNKKTNALNETYIKTSLNSEKSNEISFKMFNSQKSLSQSGFQSQERMLYKNRLSQKPSQQDNLMPNTKTQLNFSNHQSNGVNKDLSKSSNEGV